MDLEVTNCVHSDIAQINICKKSVITEIDNQKCADCHTEICEPCQKFTKAYQFKKLKIQNPIRCLACIKRNVKSIEYSKDNGYIKKPEN